MWSKSIEIFDPYEALMETKTGKKGKTMKKNKLKDYIKNLGDFMQAALLFLMMGIGWLTVYSMVWVMIGLPVAGWSLILLAVMAGATEYGYYKWIRL